MLKLESSKKVIDMEINYIDSPIGILRYKIMNEKLIALNKVDIIDDKVRSKFKSELAIKIETQLKEYFNGNRKIFDIPLEMNGTEFQKKVWNALLEIPYGETKTYKDIAIAIGNEKACRAVGMANNKNDIMIIIPCHRVIGANNKLVGYYYGIEMKEKLLDIERNYKYNM